MEQKENLTEEVKKLNHQLKELRRSGRYMIYSANPFKFAFFNFLAGIAHSLGSIFSYIIIAAVGFYLLKGVDLAKLTSQWMENSLKNIKWDKIMPQPKMPSNLDLNDLKLPQELKIK